MYTSSKLFIWYLFIIGTFLLNAWKLEGKTVAQVNITESEKQRIKRQQIEDDDPPGLCDFGSGSSLQFCGWNNPPNTSSRLQWKTGQGLTAFWLGGPRTDRTSSDENGGYVFFETSFEPPDTSQISTGVRPGQDISLTNNRPYTPTINNNQVDMNSPDSPRESAILISRNISRTGPGGLCLSFFFRIEGLSADMLSILLRDMETNENSTLWESRDILREDWQKGEIAYTYGGLHLILFEAIPKKITDPARAFRGYIALDDIQFQQLDKDAPDNCLGHCTFEGGYCGWINADDDDFNWELGRSSHSFLTGPSRDFNNFGKGDQTGGFVFIDASFPRRPGDKARLTSPAFQATGDNNPICMHFATHMFGNGVGVLRVLQKVQGGEKDRVIWEINGEAGNNWYTAQVSVSSATPYQLIFEGIVGVNSLGNIAIDNISFHPGTCPITPQAAATYPGDCNFEEDTCGWINAPPSEGVDDFDWIRQYSFSVNSPPNDHTKGTSDGYYINLSSNSELPQRGGTRSWLISPKLTPSGNSRCISFFYYMYERTIDPLGPSLGSLKIYAKPSSSEGTSQLTPIWRLSNHQGQRWLMARAPINLGKDRTAPTEEYQIIIEGIWGDGRVGHIALDDISFFDGDCSTQPSKGRAINGECSFDRDMCGWRNGEALHWRLATLTNRPANLQDHTFRAQGGYCFFDIFNQVTPQKPILRSPVFESSSDDDASCMSFWFAPFGRGDSTTLSIYHVDATDPENGEKTLVWKLATQRSDNNRPEWSYGQVSIDTGADHMIEFEGEATDGGFALDDITFYGGNCQTRPERASVVPAGSGV
ncbi:MAM and LDL-receptor class A domain-containing protein 1-like isoform X2 [Centruroides sculpturatus]|uniref:MAM and LDL-receptor class A domain-containing protein 1-like isoform X2 n=1 Tax=Centruroides sculpturatus TaxID=218467 RepID=UPI000C6CB7F1|nr:MAM and LDL-receptor class A domain-containing protein 1-like isoform X2 [Centruroides sculpturatus]